MRAALRTVALTDLFGEAVGAATIDPGGRFIPQALCSAFWDKPDREGLEAALNDYYMRRMRATATGQELDEPEPPGPMQEASLTIVLERYGSAAEAVAGLERAVATLTEGLTVSVGGRESTHPRRVRRLARRRRRPGDLGTAAQRPVRGPHRSPFRVMVAGFDPEENQAQRSCWRGGPRRGPERSVPQRSSPRRTTHPAPWRSQPTPE